MEIDLEQKSKELKALVSQFETYMFLGDLSSMIPFISMEKPTSFLRGLSSPLRQLYYLAALNLTSSPPETQELRPQYSQEEWDKMKLLLNEIEAGYERFFYPKSEDEVDEDWKHRRLVAMPSFLSYFNHGPLNYEEQIIERVQQYFSPFNQEIVHEFGIGVGDFIDVYNYLDSLPNKFFEEKINKKEGQQSWEEFGQSMLEKGLTPDKWKEHLPEHFNNLFNFMYDKGQMGRFSRKDLEKQFDKQKADAFLNVLVCTRTESNFLYYTEQNILHHQPIFLVEKDEFQCFQTKQIIHAIYYKLQDFCTRDKKSSENFYAVRAGKLEDKIVSVFQNFFDHKAQVFRSFYTQDRKEQDILILIDNLALIVEAKASKRKEPRRDPDKAYPLILSNFDEVIQKGYDQTYRVKSKFLKKKPFKIYRDQNLKKLEAEINAKKYYHVFSLVVTLEGFGQIQTDLSELLEIWDNDQFPWSICIDDLEVFLLGLKQMKDQKKGIDLIQFLHMREKMHQKTFCADELEICGSFLTNNLSYKNVTKLKMITFTPGMSGIFDKFYHKGGLGFSNEKNMHYKTSGGHIIIGE